MIRLSRQAWNNVLIVTMIVMIFLFNSTNNILTDGAEEESQVQPILPQGSLILTIEVGTQKIERIGRSWRANPSLDISDEALSNIVSHWQSGLMVAEEAVTPENALVVVIWLAGESKGRVFQLIQQQESVHLVFENKQYRVLELTLSQLIPEALNNA